MPPISVLMKPSSGMCNMHCDYCFYCDEAQKRLQKSYGFMSEETLKCNTKDHPAGGRRCFLCFSGWRTYPSGTRFFQEGGCL